MERGVYNTRWRSASGDEVLIAVNSEGRVLAHVTVTDSSQRESVSRELNRLLDLLDPESQLRVLG